MADQLFKCKHCNETKPKDSFVKAKSCKFGIRMICESCSYKQRKAKRGDYNKEWYRKNKEHRREYGIRRWQDPEVRKRQQILSKEWRDNNPERLRHYTEKQNYRYNTDSEYKARVVAYNKKTIETLPDHYVIGRLVQCDGFTKEYLLDNPEIIEIKRLILKTKRL